MLRRVVALKLTDVSEVITASIIRAVFIHFNVTTQRYIPEDSKLHEI
jgi:hypothetical protein